MRIGVAKEIKPDEYRVALTPAGALELINARPRGRGRDGRRGRQRVPRRRLRARRRADRVGRRRLGALRPGAEGQGADRVGVRAAARRADPLHLPAHRGRRAADARARRLGRHAPSRTRRSRSDRALPLLAPMSEVAGRLASQAGAYFLEKPLGGRGPAARRRARRRAGTRRDRRRRRRRLQRRGDRARARRPGDDPRALDRPHAPPRGDPLGARRRC